MKILKETDYKTKDFYTSCLLLALGFKFERLERGDDRFSYFIFEDPRIEADSTVSRYWNRQQQIEAKDLVDAIHDLKAILYSKP